MQTPAIRLILEEHRELTSVLRSLRTSTEKARGTPDFDRLRAMLAYLDDAPAQLHHASESELLFPRIRERCPALRPVLDRLDAEHAKSEVAVRELEHALGAWEAMGDEGRRSFERLVHAHTTLYLGHMEVEESYVLPVADDFLFAADWRELDDALRGRRETQDSTLARSRRELYSRIVACSSLTMKHT